MKRLSDILLGLLLVGGISLAVWGTVKEEAWAEELKRPRYLTGKEANVIKGHWTDYKYAADTVGVPVEALPAIHYRESGLTIGWYSKRRKKEMRNIGGPFMLDLGGEGPAFGKRIRAYEKKVYSQYGGKGKAPRVSHDFRFACLVAAHELKTKLRGDKWTRESLADALWGYNGRTGAPIAESSYLWSDPKIGKKLTVSVVHKGKRISFVDSRPGVVVIYDEIRSFRQSLQTVK